MSQLQDIATYLANICLRAIFGISLAVRLQSSTQCHEPIRSSEEDWQSYCPQAGPQLTPAMPEQALREPRVAFAISGKTLGVSGPCYWACISQQDPGCSSISLLIISQRFERQWGINKSWGGSVKVVLGCELWSLFPT